MTVANESSRKTFTGDGVTTSFATSPVVFFETSNLVVSVVTTATGAATTLTEDTHYTVSGGDGSTGTVSLAGGSSPYGAPSALQTLVIVRDLPLTQSADPDNGDSSDAEVIEEVADRLTMMSQQLQRQLDGAFRLADTDVSGADATIPTPVASRLIGWNSDADALQNYAAADIDLALVSAFAETILDDSTAAEARTTLGAAATGSANTFTADQTIQSTDAGATVGPKLILDRDSASPAASDVLGAIDFLGEDSGGGDETYARIQAEILDPTAATEDGTISFYCVTAGSLASRRLRVGPGLIVGSPTGGDQGGGTVNATGYYINGAAVSAISAYTSTGQTITAAGLLTLAHSLSAAPKLIVLKLKCTDAGGDGGYAQNDEVYIPVTGMTDSAFNYGVNCYADATNVYVRYGSLATPFFLLNKSSGNVFNADITKWQLLVRAYTW